MKLVATAALLALLPGAALAQAKPPVAPATGTAPATSAKFGLDTPLEQLVVDPKAKAVLDADLPGTTTHPSFETFKGMSLNQLKAYAADQLTDARLAKVQADLSAIR